MFTMLERQIGSRGCGGFTQGREQVFAWVGAAVDHSSFLREFRSFSDSRHVGCSKKGEETGFETTYKNRRLAAVQDYEGRFDCRRLRASRDILEILQEELDFIEGDGYGFDRSRTPWLQK